LTTYPDGRIFYIEGPLRSELDIEEFGWYLNWLYTGHIAIPISLSKKVYPDQAMLARLWALGDIMGSPGFQIEVLGYFTHCIVRGILATEDILFVYQNIPPNSRMVQLVMEFTKAVMGSPCIERAALLPSNFPQRFLPYLHQYESHFCSSTFTSCRDQLMGLFMCLFEQ
jgi:hypothetical protein